MMLDVRSTWNYLVPVYSRLLTGRSDVKRILLLVLVFSLVGFAVQAQVEQTIWRSNRGFSGFQVSPVLKPSLLNNSFTVYSGGRFSWLFNRSMGLGAGIYTNIIRQHADTDSASTDISLTYYGLDYEYIYKPLALWHLTGQLVVGAGDFGFYTESNTRSRTHVTALLVEPMIGVEVNFTTWFRIGAGIGYRYINSLDSPEIRSRGLTDTDLSGPTAALQFKWGRF